MAEDDITFAASGKAFEAVAFFTAALRDEGVGGTSPVEGRAYEWQWSGAGYDDEDDDEEPDPDYIVTLMMGGDGSLLAELLMGPGHRAAFFQCVGFCVQRGIPYRTEYVPDGSPTGEADPKVRRLRDYPRKGGA